VVAGFEFEREQDKGSKQVSEPRAKRTSHTSVWCCGSNRSRLATNPLQLNAPRSARRIDHLAIEQLDLSENRLLKLERLRELITVQSSLRILKLNDNKGEFHSVSARLVTEEECEASCEIAAHGYIHY